MSLKELPLSPAIDAATSDRLRKRGVRFVVPSPGDADLIARTFAFYLGEYAPDEPWSRSFLLMDADTWLDGLYNGDHLHWAHDHRVEHNVNAGTSVLAVDGNDNIIGMALGHYSTPQDRASFADRFWQWFYLILATFFFWALPRKILRSVTTLHQFMNVLTDDPVAAVKPIDPDCKKVFILDDICVARTSRGMKLGYCMAQQSMDLARRKGCDYYFGNFTGIYSQRIFLSEIGFTRIKELFYHDVRDKYGNEVIIKREHKSTVQAYKKL